MLARALILLALLVSLAARLYFPNPLLLALGVIWSAVVALVYFRMVSTGRTGSHRAVFFLALAVFFLMNLHLGGDREETLSPYCHLSLAGNVLHVGYNQFLAVTNNVWFKYGSLSVGILWLLIIVAGGGTFCAWICFFGGVDDALSRIPRRPVLRLPPSLKAREFQFALLLFFVFFSFIHFEPLFCKWVCPFKVSNSILNENSRFFTAQVFSYAALGVVFLLAMPLLTGKRTFCSFICPFGAIPPFLRGILPYRLKIDQERCMACKKCVDACPSFAMRDLGGEVKENRYCTLCMRCAEACEQEAIKLSLSGRSESALPAFMSMGLGGTLSLFYVPGGAQALVLALARMFFPA